ncbi:hypothetical protein, partial [Tritonibacter mobilis]|uniref:hypothetical protein n=1 Tax=Tritonibacter mobilis TaxID=379347 RepID=UPI00194E229A
RVKNSAHNPIIAEDSIYQSTITLQTFAASNRINNASDNAVRTKHASNDAIFTEEVVNQTIFTQNIAD